MNNRDGRRWRITSDYLGNDPGPYTTEQLLAYAADCNTEHLGDPDWTPFELVVMGDQVLDLSQPPGSEGYVAAVLA